MVGSDEVVDGFAIYSFALFLAYLGVFTAALAVAAALRLVMAVSCAGVLVLVSVTDIDAVVEGTGAIGTADPAADPVTIGAEAAGAEAVAEAAAIGAEAAGADAAAEPAADAAGAGRRLQEEMLTVTKIRRKKIRIIARHPIIAPVPESLAFLF